MSKKRRKQKKDTTSGHDEWLELSMVLVEACVDEVYAGDPTSFMWTSLAVHWAAEFLWHRRQGKDVAWEHFNPDEWVVGFRLLHGWTEQLELNIVPTVYAFVCFLRANGHLDPHKAAPILERLNVLSAPAIALFALGADARSPADLPN